MADEGTRGKHCPVDPEHMTSINLEAAPRYGETFVEVEMRCFDCKVTYRVDPLEFDDILNLLPRDAVLPLLTGRGDRWKS